MTDAAGFPIIMRCRDAMMSNENTSALTRDAPLPGEPRRVYLDNAATSFPKPPAVLEAMTQYALELGASAGRGAYREALETGALIADCRVRLCHLFHGERPEHFVFT